MTAASRTGATPPVYDRVGLVPLYGLSSSGEAAAAGYWAGFRPGPALGTRERLSLAEAWADPDGVYLFCDADPTGRPAEFLAGLDALGLNQRFLWIGDPAAPPDSWSVARLSAMPESGTGPDWLVTRSGRFQLGGYAVEIDNGTRLALTGPEDPAPGIALPEGGLWLVAPIDSYPGRPGTGLLPLTGTDLGAWTATLDFPNGGDDGLPDDLTRLGVQLRYARPDPEGTDYGLVQPIPLPVLSQDGQALAGRLAFDPLYPLLADRTAIGIAPEPGPAAGGGTRAVDPTASPLGSTGPALGTTLRTALGHRVRLAPATAWPPLRSARLVFAYSPLYTDPDPSYRDYYLAPDGAFELTFAPQPGTVQDRRLLLGLSGGEYVQLPDTAIVQFAAGNAAYAPAADVTGPAAAGPGPAAATSADNLLTAAATTSYLSILPPRPQPTGLVYYAQPQQSPWYTADPDATAGFLSSRPLPAAWLPPLPATGPAAEAPAAIPVAGYTGVAKGLVQAARLLEETALAPARRAAVGDPPGDPGDPGAPGAPGDPVTAGPASLLRVVTPQGLLADVSPGDDPLTAQWRRLVIGSFPGEDVPELAFTEVGSPLRAALQTGELFLVVADVDTFMQHGSVGYALDATGCDVLQNEGVPEPVVRQLRALIGTDYPNEADFLAALPADAAGYQAPILAVAGRLKAVIEDWAFQLSPRSWRTEPASPTLMILKFAGRPLGVLADEPGTWGWPAAAGEVAATREVLSAIFGAAARAPEGSPYQRFYQEVVADPAWNGVLFLNAPVSVAELPADLQFVTAGIDPDRFYAHHIGFSVTPVHAADGTIDLGRTAAFGLLHYDDPADLVLASSVPYAFKTQQLSVRFAGGRIADLSAQVELMVNRLFGAQVAIDLPDHGNNLVLAGAYQRQNGAPAYNFSLTRRCDFRPAGSMLNDVEVTAVGVQTSAGSAADGLTTVDFVLSGAMRFGELPAFDLFSYGQEKTAPVGQRPADGYLRYGNLVVRMQFAATDPGRQSFTVDESRISLDPDASVPRAQSLVAKFPLRARGVLAVPAPPPPAPGRPAPVGQRPEDLGYVSVLAPLDQSPLTPPWYGLLMDLDLGTLGDLAGSAGVTVTVLAGWATGIDYPAYLGLQLSGGPSDAGLPVQGVLRLGFRSLEFQVVEQDGPREYLLVLRHLALSLLGWSLPSGDLDVVLFGDPAADGATALGWYAAYTGAGAPGSGGTNPSDGGLAATTTPGARRAPRRPDPAIRRLRSGRRALPPGSGLRGDPGAGPRADRRPR